MPATKISALTDGTTADATDALPVARSGANVYITPAYIRTYILGLSNTFTRLQTITQGTANEGVIASTGYSLTGSNATSMLDFAGTWNTTGVPTALKINITNTASGSNALMFDYQIGGTSRYKYSPTGGLFTITDPTASSYTWQIYTGTFGSSPGRQVTHLYNTRAIYAIWGVNATDESLMSIGSGGFSWSGGANVAPDLFLRRDAANIMAQRNGTTAQTNRIYTTWTDASNGEWLEFGSASSVPYVGATKNGTGTQRALNLQRVATPAAGSSSAAVLLGTTAAFGIYYGSGAPTVTAAQGSIYLRSDGSGTGDRLYVNTTGSTTWTAVTTAA